MRFLSRHENYSIQVFEGKEQIVTDPRGYAQTITLQKPVVANFEKSGLLDHEQELALMTFNFSGLPEGINPLTTISVFDTEMYVDANFEEDERDDMDARMVARLIELHERHPSQFVPAPQPLAARPWPSYDKMDADEILRTREVLDANPESIRLYELENYEVREKQVREEIVEAMLDLEDPARVEARAAEEAAWEEQNAKHEAAQAPLNPESQAPKDGEITVPA